MHSQHLQATPRKEPWTLFRLIHIIPLALLMVVAAVVFWLWGYLQSPTSYPIQHVKISTKGQYMPGNAIRNIIINHVHGGFFSVDTSDLKSNLLANPWIKSVSIRRIWPNSLHVALAEYEPWLRWGDDGILSRDGTVFYPKSGSAPTGLAEVQAPLSQKDKVISSMLYFNKLLQPLHLSITKLTVSDRLAWSVILSNGLTVNLCRNDILKRFSEFASLYPKVTKAKSASIVSANLCYPNGLAIMYK